MANVNLPTPVALAGAAICALGGYLLGVVTGPDQNPRTTATVESYDAGTGRLCLTGKGVNGQAGGGDDTLCGTWRRDLQSTRNPRKGDSFRFVSLTSRASKGGGGGAGPVTIIYGDVVPR
jgi:hypothetical protein